MYRELYRRRQHRAEEYLPKSWYINDALELQWVEGIRTLATDALQSSHLLGFIVKHNAGFLGGLQDNYSIVTAGDLTPEWERFVVIKELMHCYFNCDDEQHGKDAATDSEILLDSLLRHFFGKSAESPSAQINAERTAFWMAMGALCRENQRLTYKNGLGIDTTAEGVAATLRVPVSVVQLLLSDQYEDEIRHLIA